MVAASGVASDGECREHKGAANVASLAPERCLKPGIVPDLFALAGRESELYSRPIP
jgi:hypothetical protein